MIALDIEHAVWSRERARQSRPPVAAGQRLLDQPASQGMVGLVARSLGDDEPLEVEAQERQVTDQVEYLVPRAFVVVTQEYCR